MVWIGLMSMALAGYGDPVDGLPSPAEREELVREIGETAVAVAAPSHDAWAGFTVLAKRPQAALDRPPRRRIGQGERNQVMAHVGAASPSGNSQ